jgi:hypothetical protein
LIPGVEEGDAGLPSWSVKTVGDTQLYNQLPPKEGTTTYATVVIKSLRWPGSITVSQVMKSLI